MRVLSRASGTRRTPGRPVVPHSATAEYIPRRWRGTCSMLLRTKSTEHRRRSDQRTGKWRDRDAGRGMTGSGHLNAYCQAMVAVAAVACLCSSAFRALSRSCLLPFPCAVRTNESRSVGEKHHNSIRIIRTARAAAPTSNLSVARGLC